MIEKHPGDGAPEAHQLEKNRREKRRDLTNKGTVSTDDREPLDSELPTTLKRNPAAKLMLAETTSEEIEKIVEESMAKLQNREGAASVVVLIQDSAGEDVLAFHNCDAETAKSILADAWAKLDHEG